MKKIQIIPLFFLFFITGCVSSSISYNLEKPTIIKNANLHDYKYVYINSTVPVNSSISSSVVSGYGSSVYGSAYSEDKNVNPKDVISGCLMKHGFIVINDFNDNNRNSETLILTYGESGRRYISSSAYTTEITIQFISPVSNELLFSATAEGIGRTEVDDIKIAIQRAIEELFKEE